MTCFRFGQFHLDPGDRQLKRGGTAVELNARYLDALTLLVSEQGKLVSKDRFLDEVWRGVPVTDEALTQCIKTLRRQLGDDAAAPRFIETVPKHGYRFVASVEVVVQGEAADAGNGSPASDPGSAQPAPSAGGGQWQSFFNLAGAGTIGGAIAGFAGGLIYGVAGASQPLQPGSGASVLLVLLWLTVAAALMGGAGVSFGIAAGRMVRGDAWIVAGGAIGGTIVGGFAKLLGLDAFNLLLGRSPGDVTGAGEGLAIGAAVGIGALLAIRRDWSTRRSVAAAALIGALAGMLIALMGGTLMGGSLSQLADSFPDSRLRIDPLGALFGEAGFGPVSEMVTAALEVALFAGCVVGAMRLALGPAGERTP